MWFFSFLSAVAAAGRAAAGGAGRPAEKHEGDAVKCLVCYGDNLKCRFRKD